MTRVQVPYRQDVDDQYMDWWSLTHVAWGFVLAMVMPAFWAFAIMVLWEPLELLVLNPLLARYGIDFASETLRNSLMDLIFDFAGVVLGAFVVRPLWDPLGNLVPWLPA